MLNEKTIPSINDVSKDNYDDFCNLTSEFQVDDTEFESFLETHRDEMDTFLEDVSEYSVTKLRDDLTLAVIESLPFPYKTKLLKSKRKEIIDWLNRHKSMRTNNIDLLRQRITNHFKLEVHNMLYYKQEKISTMVQRKLDYLKQNLE